MKYKIETWTIDDLLNLYDSKKLNLNPDYQRNFIWSLKDQLSLIDSIFKGYAIPNLFLYEKTEGNFEMVDGQQRTRTILGFFKEQLKFEGALYDKVKHKFLLDYKLAVIVIESLNDGEKIEDFYSLVNNTGLHLNRPELKKAEYFESNFLKLITEISVSDKFESLDLFTDATSKRMVDVDFVSELLTLLLVGNTDKKITVDRKFEEDISVVEYDRYLKQFNKVLDVICQFNDKFPISKTRYKQRNDFYSVFGFIKEAQQKGIKNFAYFYEILVKFNDFIKPSTTKCPPFQNYAFHCISQSNSKNARDHRSKILEQMFLNVKSIPNKTQKDILKFFKADGSSENLKKVENFYTLDLSKIDLDEHL